MVSIYLDNKHDTQCKFIFFDFLQKNKMINWKIIYTSPIIMIKFSQIMYSVYNNFKY